MNPNSPEQEFTVKWSVKSFKDSPKIKNHSSIKYGGKFILFGGYDGKNNLNTIYFFDILKESWSVKTSTGDIPRERNGHSASLLGDKMYIVGGWLGTGALASDEVFELDLINFEWKKVLLEGQGIGSLNMHSAEIYNGKIIIFRGGNGREYLNDLISINIKKMKCKIIQSKGKIPQPRANHGSAMIGSNLYLFGGWNGSKILNDFYMINLENKNWINIEKTIIRPSPRAGMSLLNYKNEYIILFGGSGSNSICLNDLMFYDINNNSWFIPSKVLNTDNCPSERTGQTVEIVNSKLYLYGGNYGNSYMTDMHMLEIDPKPDIIKKIMNSKENFIYFTKEFYDNPTFSDVILEIEGKEIKAHKVILSILSEKFKNMFCCGLFESNKKKIIIKEHKLAYFEYILKYMYSTEIENDSLNPNWAFDDYIKILKLSDEYFIIDIKEFAQQKIISLVTLENFSKVNYIAKKYKADTLYLFCKWFQRQNKEYLGIDLLDDTFSEIY